MHRIPFITIANGLFRPLIRFSMLADMVLRVAMLLPSSVHSNTTIWEVPGITMPDLLESFGEAGLVAEADTACFLNKESTACVCVLCFYTPSNTSECK